MVKQLKIQTREEFVKETYRAWRFQEGRKEDKKSQKRAMIQGLQRQIDNLKEEISKVKPQTLKAYREENTYEDWVKKVRKNGQEGYEIVENKDSKEVI